MSKYHAGKKLQDRQTAWKLAFCCWSFASYLRLLITTFTFDPEITAAEGQESGRRGRDEGEREMDGMKGRRERGKNQEDEDAARPR